MCLAPVVVLLFYYLPSRWFFFLVMAISAMGVYELANMARIGDRLILLMLMIPGMVFLFLKSFDGYMAYLLGAAALYLIFKIIRGDSAREGINNDTVKGFSVILFSGLFVILPVYYLYLLKETAVYLPLILLLSIWASDTGAYFIGKRFGKRPLVPKISPKKTYAGLSGAVAGSALVMALSSPVLGMHVLEAFAVGAVMGLLGQLGDILESAGKRVCETKDSSSLIPGHGGILDRMDSFIFTSPFLFHYLTGVRL